jgi:hypothetical protein
MQSTTFPTVEVYLHYLRSAYKISLLVSDLHEKANLRLIYVLMTLREMNFVMGKYE